MAQTITLANLGGGAAVEKFDEAFQKVIENIQDPNTEPMAKREVILKVVLKPDKDRRFVALGVYASEKLAPAVGYATRAYIGMHGDKVVACEDNPNQLTIGDFLSDEKVTPIVSEEDEAQG